MTSWNQIWNKRSDENTYQSTLEELIRLDGFDTGAGFIKQEDWENYVKQINEAVGIDEADSIFEVGCGSGAFLYPLFQKGHLVGGIDYSAPLVAKANSTLTGMKFDQIEANQLNTKEKFDIVLSNGVFHYFPNLDYTEAVLDKMLEKSNKKVAVLEVPNLALKEESEYKRRGDLGIEEYNQKYEGLPHLYYSKEWFVEYAAKRSLSVEIKDQSIENYGNNKFRFNIFFTHEN